MTVPLRAALYLRVSTPRQAEHDVSIPDQKRSGGSLLRLPRLPAVHGAAIFLKSGAGKFPSLAGWRSAVGEIGSSVF